jgi:hypothetical protein
MPFATCRFIKRVAEPRVAVWHETLTWHPLADRHLERCAAVLVRMLVGIFGRGLV